MIDPIVIVAILIFAVLIAAFADGRVSREIPISDLVEIKHYPGKEKVTIVLDDERTKRGSQNRKA